MYEKAQMLILGLVLSIAIIISTYLVTDVIRDVRLSHQIIKVRGYAEKVVDSDLAIWGMNLSVRNRDMIEGFTAIESNKNQVLSFLRDNGINDSEIGVFSVSVREQMKKNEKGHETNEVDYFILSQKLEVTSYNVQKISKLSTEINQLMKQGLAVHSSSPSYYYSRVNELKTELLTEATRDARMRAKTLAEGSGVKLGFLRAARQGVFSIRSAKSTSISSDRSYDDVSSITKKITAVVTVDYSMK